MLESYVNNVQNGGNMTFAVTNDGVILVDGNFAPVHDKIKAAIAAVAPNQPVKYLINTHFHGDHTGGNAGFAQEGVTVLAEDWVRYRLGNGTVNGLTGNRTPPAPPAALPKEVYADTKILELGGRTAHLGHPTNAHTDGDTFVYLRDANVLSTGDIVTFGRYPNIDFANGGNIRGMITAVDGYLNIANDNTKIVPGHGPLGNKAMLREYRQMLVNARDNVAKLIDAGKSIDEAVAAKPNAQWDTKLGMNEMQAGNFVRVVYRSLKPEG
jgi:glyoxylase-like metal-dependent hydrolase (beta-lactamase superfamily II)